MASFMTSPGPKLDKKFEIDISPAIFQLERRSKAQHIGNAPGYLIDIINFGITAGKISLSLPQNGGHFENI